MFKLTFTLILTLGMLFLSGCNWLGPDDRDNMSGDYANYMEKRNLERLNERYPSSTPIP